ncbi:MAG TPA: hypothetical protein VOA87_18095, partial [Thermoanaerobaculia bacterium]|nr:hypothetical protein [Thermoanaerobaculia bacterium]
HPPGGAERWPLPAQGLLGLLGGLPRGGAAGWSIVAFDSASLGRAVALAPALARLLPPAATPPAGPSRALRLGIWLRPAPALRLVADLRKICEQVPLVERRQVQRFRDWEALLTPLARCRRAALLAAGPPESFAVRLSGCD